MSKPIISLLVAFLALWLFGGAFWLSTMQSRNTSEQMLPDNNRLIIQDGEFKMTAQTIFAFQPSDADIIINEEQMSVLDSLASYLEGAKEKKIRLIAYYGKNETNRTKYENLGIARAGTIKNILVRRGAPENSIGIEGKLLKKLVLNENGILSGGVEFDIFDKDISNTITEAPFLKEKIFYFQKNKYVLLNNDDLESYAAVLKQYLVDEKDSEVIITGFREEIEHQSIDLLRAKFVEDVFIKHGIDLERISIDMNEQVGKNKKSNESIDDKKVEIKVH